MRWLVLLPINSSSHHSSHGDFVLWGADMPNRESQTYWGWWAAFARCVGAGCPNLCGCPWKGFLVTFLGSAGLSSPMFEEDDQTMEIWPAGLRSAFGPIALVILALRAFFNGLYSDFGPRNLSL